MRVKVTTSFESNKAFPSDNLPSLRENMHLLFNNALVEAMMKAFSYGDDEPLLKDSCLVDMLVWEQLRDSLSVELGDE